MSNYKVLGLYPNTVDKLERTVKGSVYVDKVIAFESVKSANIPILLQDGRLFTHKDFIWLRSPIMLLEEYLRLRWEEMGGTWSTDSADNRLKLVLRNCYISEKTKRFYVELQIICNEQSNVIEKNSDLNHIAQTMIHVIEEGLDFMSKHIR